MTLLIQKLRETLTDKDFTRWYTQTLNGFDAGEAPTIEAAEKVYFSETKIEEYKNKLEIIDLLDQTLIQVDTAH